MQGGPQGGMSYMVAGAPRGMSTNDMWAHVDSLLQQAFILKGDMVGAQRAREYVFQTQHAGANQMLMQAYRALAVGDAGGAAQFLAKSHAFVPDGSTMAFKVGPNNTLWGQRFVDATGQPVGKPLQVTPQGVATMLNQTLDPQQFLKTLNTERSTIAKIAHNQAMEGLRGKQIDTTAGTAEAARVERQRSSIAAQQGADRRAELHAQTQLDIAGEAVAARREAKAADEGKVANARRTAITKQASDYYVDAQSGVYVGADMTPGQRSQSMDIFGSLRTHNPEMQAGSAVETTQGILSGTHNLQGLRLKNGRIQYAVTDPKGAVVAYLPQAAVQGHSVPPGGPKAQPQQAGSSKRGDEGPATGTLVPR